MFTFDYVVKTYIKLIHIQETMGRFRPYFFMPAFCTDPLDMPMAYESFAIHRPCAG